MKTDVVKLDGDKPLETSSIGITISLDAKDKIKDVNAELEKNIIHCFLIKENVLVKIHASSIHISSIHDLKYINQSFKFKNQEVKFPFMKTIDVNEIIALYGDKLKGFDKYDTYVKNAVVISEQVVLMIANFWMRNNIETFIFQYDKSEQGKLTFGFDKDISNEEMEKVVKSIHNYKMKVEGSFLEKDWLNADPTDGGGKL